MPVGVVPEGSNPAQNTIGILVRGYVRQGEGVGREDGRGHQIPVYREQHISSVGTLLREILIRLDSPTILNAFYAGVVIPHFAKKHIEGNRVSALGSQLVDQTAINVARPVQPMLIAEATAHIVVGEDPLSDKANRVLVNRDESEVSCVLGG